MLIPIRCPQTAKTRQKSSRWLKRLGSTASPNSTSSREPIQSLSNPISHIIFSLNKLLDISCHIKLVVLTYTTGPDIEWQDDPLAWRNEISGSILKRFLLGHLGKLPGKYTANDVGSVLIVRQDRKPLLPEHTEVFVEFGKGLTEFRLRHLMEKDFKRYGSIVKKWKWIGFSIPPYAV